MYVININLKTMENLNIVENDITKETKHPIEDRNEIIVSPEELKQAKKESEEKKEETEIKTKGLKEKILRFFVKSQEEKNTIYENKVNEFMADEKKIEQAEKLINEHPAKKINYEIYKDKNDTEKINKYRYFVFNNPKVKYIAWDKEQRKFFDNTIYSVASGEGLSGK